MEQIPRCGKFLSAVLALFDRETNRAIIIFRYQSLHLHTTCAFEMSARQTWNQIPYAQLLGFTNVQ